MPVSGPEGPTTGSFRASDLLRVAGLTYRQLNDWEKRGGVLSSERATEDGWRRFTGEEVLALSVCARLRRQLSLPLPQIGQLYLWLVGRKPDKVCSLLAEVAEFTLSSMERNEKIVRLLARRGEALTEALKEPANAHIVREYVGAKLNRPRPDPGAARRQARIALPLHDGRLLDDLAGGEPRALGRHAGRVRADHHLPAERDHQGLRAERRP